MRIVIGNFNFIRPAGSETYVLTVASRLSRLGHDVIVYAQALGELVEEARRQGVIVVGELSALPDACDVVFAQDAPTAYALADRYPGAPLVFVCHSVVFDTSHPPRLADAVRAIVVLNGRTEAHMRAFATPAEIVRLTQPVDTERFTPHRALGERAERVLLLGNYLHGPRRDTLVEAVRAEGLELVEIGRHAGRFRTDVELAMDQADIVVGRGRVMVEAMACGRPAYLYDVGGTDGWITAESYRAIEANNFSGQATDRVPDPDAIRADLRAYDPRMGPVNRDLAFTHHSHTTHVEALLELFARLAGTGSPAPGPLGEMAWLARQNWLLESRAYDLGLEVGRLHEELRAAHAEGLARERALAAERDEAHAQAAAWVERALEAERLAAPLHALVGTRRWRLATALARPLDRVRALRRR